MIDRCRSEVRIDRDSCAARPRGNRPVVELLARSHVLQIHRRRPAEVRACDREGLRTPRCHGLRRTHRGNRRRHRIRVINGDRPLINISTVARYEILRVEIPSSIDGETVERRNPGGGSGRIIC